jgi:copper(I)-binding protein
MRYLLPSRPAAGYFVLHNDTGAARMLVGASSPACGELMLHQSMHESGMENMRMVDSVTLPAHGSVSFAPGGYHLMCESPAQTLKPGARVPVTLRFQGGGTLTADFPVRNAAGDMAAPR